MATMNDEIGRQELFYLFKGEPGTRKSTCALSFPIPQYWFSFDKKMGSMLLPMSKFGIKSTDITYDDYIDYTKAEQKLTQLQTNCPYKTIIIDSITSLGDTIMAQTMKYKQGGTRKSGAAAGKVVGGISVNELEDYNAESSAILDVVSKLKDIHTYHKVNVILIAHVIQAEYKTVGGETHFSRSIVTAAKKVAAKIPAYCEEVYHFNIDRGFIEGGEGSYALLTTHTGDDFARTGLPLDKKIVFGDQPLYKTYIVPALAKLKASVSESLPSTETTQTKTNW
jgi:hypothetical protein